MSFHAVEIVTRKLTGTASIDAPALDSAKILSSIAKQESVSDSPQGPRKAVSDMDAERVGIGAMVQIEPQ